MKKYIRAQKVYRTRFLQAPKNMKVGRKTILRGQLYGREHARGIGDGTGILRNVNTGRISGRFPRRVNVKGSNRSKGYIKQI